MNDSTDCDIKTNMDKKNDDHWVRRELAGALPGVAALRAGAAIVKWRPGNSQDSPSR
jgi:hypothetical protein